MDVGFPPPSEVERLGNEFNGLPQTSVEVKNKWIYTSPPPVCLCLLSKHLFKSSHKFLVLHLDHLKMVNVRAVWPDSEHRRTGYEEYIEIKFAPVFSRQSRYYRF